MREWVELCSKDGYHAPSASEVGLHHAPVAGKAKRRVSRRATTETEATDVKEEDEAINVPASPPITDLHAAGSPKEEDEDAKSSRPHRRKTHKQVADEKAVKDVAFMAKFKPHEDWLPFGMQPSDYTPEYCKELERHYWRNCGMGKSPWYGADTQGQCTTILLAICVSDDICRVPVYPRYHRMECLLPTLVPHSPPPVLLARPARRQYSLPLLWHVASDVCLARRRYGPVQHQLHPLRRTQVLVCHPSRPRRGL